MRPPKKPGLRLPAHLGGPKSGGARKPGGSLTGRLRGTGLLRGELGSAERSGEQGERPRTASPAPAPAAPDRLGSLVEPVLVSLFGPAGREVRGPLVATREELLAALSPYHRPQSRFENLMVRRLVGDGYLTPRGGLEKQGLSGAYALTRRGERLLDLHRD